MKCMMMEKLFHFGSEANGIHFTEIEGRVGLHFYYETISGANDPF
jgi:hypothetical protein